MIQTRNESQASRCVNGDYSEIRQSGGNGNMAIENRVVPN